MRSSATMVLAIAVLAFAALPASADLSAYSQDFEGLVQTDPNALAVDGWVFYVNVFGLDWSYWGGYGGPAPNWGPPWHIATITDGQGGPPQGQQQLNVFSDYNNGDHPIAYLETNVYHEQYPGAADVGNTWIFEFDAKMGDLDAVNGVTALAFIKTLDPNAGWALTNFITQDMTSIPTTWGTYSVSIEIDASLVGQVLQFGFSNTATNYLASTVVYDNVNFSTMPPVSVDAQSWGSLKALYR